MFGDNCNNDSDDRLSELIESSYYELDRIINHTNSKNQSLHNPYAQSIDVSKIDYLTLSPQRDHVNVSMSPSHQSPSANKYYRFVPIQSFPRYFAPQLQVQSLEDEGQNYYNKLKHEGEIDQNNGQFGRQNRMELQKKGQSLPLQEANDDAADRLFEKPQQLPKHSIESNKNRQRPGFIKQQRQQTVQIQSHQSQQQYSKQNQKQIHQTTDTFLYKAHNYQQPTSSSSQSTTTTPTQSVNIQSPPHFLVPPSPNSSHTLNKHQTHLTLTHQDENFQDNSTYDLNDDDNVQNRDYAFLRRQYEQDLFEFIKQELMRVSVKNKQVLQFEDDGEEELVAARDRNRQLLSIYKQAKTHLIDTKNYQHTSLQSLQQQILILQQQLILSETQRAKISTSITQKMHKQEQLYFKHQTNLQNVILANNQTLVYLNNQVESARRRLEKQQISYVSGEQEKRGLEQTDCKGIRSLSMLEKQNELLKKQLFHEQQQFNNTFSKFLSMDSALNHLKLKKQSQLSQLYQQLEYAKQLTRSVNN